ncbi:hypothetical protein [Trinickia sp. EG282A]
MDEALQSEREGGARGFRSSPFHRHRALAYQTPIFTGMVLTAVVSK